MRNPTYQKERRALTFLASLWLFYWMKTSSKKKIINRHLFPCYDWTSEQSLAAAFRNSRQNRQNTGQLRPQGLLAFQYGGSGSTFQILIAYADFYIG